MHIEKNVCDSIVGTLLNMPGKTKDGEKARYDLQDMGIRPELVPQPRGNRTFLPPACHTLSKKEKKEFCEFLAGVKVPEGYSSNIKSLVSLNDLKLVGLKSHDCHILMQELLPIALRAVLPQHVHLAVIRLCFFFKAICSKEIDPSHLTSLQNSIILTLCELEMFFPPTFFDIMIHLTVHLVREVRLCGPVFLRWMYPFERHMKVLKGYVMNKYHPEGSIAERYIIEEAIEFCIEYLPDVDAIGLPKARRLNTTEGEGITGRKVITMDHDMLQKVHLYVLHNVDDVLPYVEEHKNTLRNLNRGRNEQWITKEHNRVFVKWFEQKLSSELEQKPNFVSDKLKWLSYGPSMNAIHFSSYAINGYTFYTKDRDDTSPMQNSGVTLASDALHISGSTNPNPEYKRMQYYGVIEQIYELEYTAFKVPIFSCNWVNSNSGVKNDELGFTMVDLNRLGHKEDPFILASQANQLFFVSDPSDKKWSIVLSSKKRFSSDDIQNDVVDENVEGNICSTVPAMEDSNFWQEIYVREDHHEGIYVEETNSVAAATSNKRRKTKRKRNNT